MPRMVNIHSFKECPKGLKSLMRGVVSVSKASGKLVWGDPCTKSKPDCVVGTDEQELNTEAIINGISCHIPVTSTRKGYSSRFSSY